MQALATYQIRERSCRPDATWINPPHKGGRARKRRLFPSDINAHLLPAYTPLQPLQQTRCGTHTSPAGTMSSQPCNVSVDANLSSYRLGEQLERLGHASVDTHVPSILPTSTETRWVGSTHGHGRRCTVTGQCLRERSSGPFSAASDRSLGAVSTHGQDCRVESTG